MGPGGEPSSAESEWVRACVRACVRTCAHVHKRRRDVGAWWVSAHTHTGDLTIALTSSPATTRWSGNQLVEAGTRILACWSGMPVTFGLVHSSMHSTVSPVWYAAGCERGGMGGGRRRVFSSGRTELRTGSGGACGRCVCLCANQHVSRSTSTPYPQRPPCWSSARPRHPTGLQEMNTVNIKLALAFCVRFRSLW